MQLISKSDADVVLRRAFLKAYAFRGSNVSRAVEREVYLWRKEWFDYIQQEYDDKVAL